ncbi:putative thioesterase [Streptomyces tateyamensis]|uniref:Putative thioesterase n=1 Tax=Streptomyces tateyamensis TaxID=565073 RepID=A0A2V4N6W5_9ACTN|nr:thioesterase domain-containing protein [Streptomyces tateyamensis]PYC77215.1 putative thioesterase [Streptomyces tateyamensis]
MTAYPELTPASWVRPLRSVARPRLRLFLFHPAGAGPLLYRDWPDRLPADLDLWAVQLPGREARFAEPLLTDYQQAVDQLAVALRPYLDRPYAFFGHSMGALLAHGVAVAGRQHGDRAPERVLFSGCPGPGSPARPDRSALTDAELVAELRRMGGTPEEVLAEPDLLELLLPILRADFAVVSSARRPEGPLLDCPVTMLGGTEDTVTVEELERWRTVSTGPGSLHVFPGGHFYLTGDSAPEVLATIADELAHGALDD